MHRPPHPVVPDTGDHVPATAGHGLDEHRDHRTTSRPILLHRVLDGLRPDDPGGDRPTVATVQAASTIHASTTSLCLRSGLLRQRHPRTFTCLAFRIGRTSIRA